MTDDRALSATHIRAFADRGIDPETAMRYGVFTGRSQPGATPDDPAEVIPDVKGNIVVFPTFDRGREANLKYRAPGKRFWQHRNGPATFWNADVLDSPALQEGGKALLIVEGEIDALTAISCGFEHTVSVPDGAPAVPKGRDPEDLDDYDPTADAEGKFEFMFNNRARLKAIRQFIIAADGDDPGKRLSAELVRRLGAARCRFVEYPAGCKDLNDVWKAHGTEGVVRCLNGAKEYPVRGYYRLSDYQDPGPLQTFATGFDNWSNKLKLFFGELMIVTGVPGEGKSTWTNNLLFNLAVTHGWKVALCSPEMRTVPVLRDRFRQMVLGRKPLDTEIEDKARADAFIERHFRFIDTHRGGKRIEDEPFNLEWIIERAEDGVMRDGIRVLCIDPWNELDHARDKGETTVDYIGRSLRELRRFAMAHDVIVIVVAHPTKDVVNKDGKPRKPTLYDIEGAAHWFNKADHGIVVTRPNKDKNEAKIYIDKVKFEEAGKVGAVAMDYDRASCKFLLPPLMDLAQ